MSLLDPSHKKFRPLHESRKYKARDRRIVKLLSKKNWFKGKQDTSRSSTEGMTTPCQRDGNVSERGRPGQHKDSIRSSHQDGNKSEDDLGMPDMDATTTTGEGSKSRTRHSVARIRRNLTLLL